MRKAITEANAQQKKKPVGSAGGQGILQSLAAPETRKTLLVNEMDLKDQQKPQEIETPTI